MIKKDFHELEGILVKLSQFKESDISKTYISWLNDPKVVQYSNQRFIKHNFLSCQNYFNTFVDSDNLFLAITDKVDGRTIGTMTVYYNRHHGVADVGIMIGDVSKWGKGYGKDAWNLFISWALKQNSVRKVTAGTLACNNGMINLIEKSGMHLEATRKSHEIVNSKAEDMLLYAIFSEN